MDFEFNSFPIECQILGALMIHADRNLHEVQTAFLMLGEDCFTKYASRELFRVIKNLYDESKSFEAVDLLTIVQNDSYWLLTEILEANTIYSKFRILPDCQTLIQSKNLRKQIKILNHVISSAQHELTPGLGLQRLQEELQNLNHSDSNKISDIKSYEQIADAYLSEDFIDDSEISVDIPRLPPVPNRALIMIAGRSGHGKTFFALYLMDKLMNALPNRQVLYFNLEMHERVMMERHARLLGITGKNRREIIKQSLPILLSKPMSLISVPMITIEEIESHCRLTALKNHLGVIVVDYIGLIRSKSKYERKDLEQSDIAKRLAALSIELNCVVIALTQVNRESKNRIAGNRCPLPSDSSESMGSVHSSSWWIGIDQPQLDSDDEEFRNLFQVQCRKNRGEGGLFNIDFDFHNCQFKIREKRFSSYQSAKQSKDIEF